MDAATHAAIDRVANLVRETLHKLEDTQKVVVALREELKDSRNEMREIAEGGIYNA